MRGSLTRDSGFTLVELIMVLILIGILSALGIGLFASNKGYTAFLARESLLSAAALAQQQALATGDPATLTITQSGDNWTFTVSQAHHTHEPSEAERSGAGLRIGNVLMGNGSVYEVNLAGNGALGTNLQLAFEGEGSYPLCIASTGFAYAGSCRL